MRTPSTLTFVQPTASLATASAAGTTRTQASFWGRLGTPTSSSFPPSTTAREGSHSGRSEVVASHPSWHWVREGVLIVAAVVLLAEGITIALIYSMSFVGDYAVTITTNTMGEFWFEFPVVIASVPLGLFALYATIGRLKVRLDERVVGPVGEGGPSRNAGGFSYVNGPTHDYPGYLTARVDAPGRERELPPPAFGRAG